MTLVTLPLAAAARIAADLAHRARAGAWNAALAGHSRRAAVALAALCAAGAALSPPLTSGAALASSGDGSSLCGADRLMGLLGADRTALQGPACRNACVFTTRATS